MTDLDPKGLVLVPREVLQAMFDRLEFCLDTFGAIQDHGSEAADIEDWRAYLASSPTPPVEAEPDGWEGYWSGAGSIDSVTSFTKRRSTMERWVGEGAEITPLYAARPTVSALQARVRELDGALTPSAETKAAYIGEFTIAVERYVDDDCEPDDETENAPDPYDHITVPWTTIKEIMAAIRARAALSPVQQDGGKPAGAPIGDGP